MGPAQKIHSDDLVIDHIQMLATYAEQISQVSKFSNKISEEVEKMGTRVSITEKELLVIKTKFAAIMTGAVLIGNILFQVGLRIFS